MFFKKKHKDEHGSPVEEVQKMTRTGMSDKDIIKKLKAKGFSYDEIERAMLQAVKSGVSDEEPMMRKAQPTVPELESFYEEQPTDDIFETPMPQPQRKQGRAQMEFEEPQEQPELMLEELIEGVIEDKWHKFESNMKKLEEDFNKMRAEMSQFQQKVESTKKEPQTKELEANFTELTERLSDIEARVGGLEKAFKQFLPSLTKNIESLSNMIHEMKSKQGYGNE